MDDPVSMTDRRSSVLGPLFNLGLLHQCQQATGSEADGRAAFTTWALAQVLGWFNARGVISRSTYFRHLGLLRKAGVPVPASDPLNTSKRLHPVNGWLSAATQDDLAARLTEDFTQVLPLVVADTAFKLTQPSEHFRTWQVGDTGRIVALLFDGVAGWQFKLEYGAQRSKGLIPAHISEDVYWVDVPVLAFFTATMPCRVKP
jgi:hypothetical protein